MLHQGCSLFLSPCIGIERLCIQIAAEQVTSVHRTVESRISVLEVGHCPDSVQYCQYPLFRLRFVVHLHIFFNSVVRNKDKQKD